jgi:small subunit ribosomal protein S16
MSVKIRMRRTGANNDMCFRVVATDSRAPRDGKCLEVLGWYDPKRQGVNYELKMDRIEYWKSKGAQISDTVASLVRKFRLAASKGA